MEAKDYIAAIRAYGLTQVQISQKTGIPQSTISKIERGDVNDVMSRNYRALQSLLCELRGPQQEAQGACCHGSSVSAGTPSVFHNEIEGV